MQIDTGTSDSEGSKEKVRKVEGGTLREVTVKIGLERIDMQEGITVEALLDSRATGLVMSSEFARKQGFKLKKLERLINVRNVDGSLKKEGPIEYMVEVNIYYQGHRKRTEIDVIGGQKWTVILGMPWLACHNPEIDWKTGGKNDEVSGGVWKTVETSTREVRMGETERRRGKGGSREKEGGTREGKEEETEKENGGSKESSRRVGDMG